MSTAPTLSASLENLGKDLGEIGGTDHSLVWRWSGIEERAHSHELTFQDWTDVQEALRQVIQGQPFARTSSYVLPLFRYLGAADHSVARLHHREESDRQRALITDSLWENRIDRIRFEVLYFVFGLPGASSPLHEGLREYLLLPPELRTHFLDEMMVADLLLGKIGALSAEDLTDNVRQQIAHSKFSPLKHIDHFFTVTNSDFKDLLQENEMHWLTQYDRMFTLLWESDKPVKIYRVHVNMTTINELDPTGELGDLYLVLVGGWLQKKFGNAHLVKNPENTSFQFIGQSADLVEKEMRYFSRDLTRDLFTSFDVSSERVHNFKPEAVVSEIVLSRGSLYDYAIKTEEDLEAFKPILELNGRFDIDDLKSRGMIIARQILKWESPDFNAIRSSRDPVLVQTLNALIFLANQEANRLLAAQTTFFEKNQTSSSQERKGSVFTEGDIPKPGDEHAPEWVRLIQSSAGYVGPGQYHPSAHPHLKDLPSHARPTFHLRSLDIQGLHINDDPALTPLVNHLLRIFPRLGRISGILSHPIRGNSGRLCDRLMEGLYSLFFPPPGTPSDERQRALSFAQQTASQLREAILSVYSFSAMDPRYAWTVKKHETFGVQRGGRVQEVESNFALQEIARFGNRFLLALEYDSLKAYLSTYPAISDDDREIFFVRDAFFLVAQEMNMDPSKIVIIPGKGDHLNISVPHEDRRGNPVDPVAYCKRIQQMVRNHYQPQLFHDFMKVESMKLFLADIGGHLSGKDLKKSAADVALSFDLNVEATLDLDKMGTDHYVLTVPKANRQGAKLSPDTIIRYLQTQGINVRLTEPAKEENRRLPIWVKREASGKIVDWYYGSHDSLPSAGYAPFKRTLTVTMAVTDHKAIRRAEDKVEFKEAVRRVDLALDAAQKESLPDKEGFRDARRSAVVLDEEAPGFSGAGSPGTMPPPANVDEPISPSRGRKRTPRRRATTFTRQAVRSSIVRAVRLAR